MLAFGPMPFLYIEPFQSYSLFCCGINPDNLKDKNTSDEKPLKVFYHNYFLFLSDTSVTHSNVFLLSFTLERHKTIEVQDNL